MTSEVFDAIVIGAGVNGSSAALHLAKSGKKTVLVEQFPVPHSRGSSTGQTRITRYAQNGHPSVSSLIIDSFQQWQELECKTGLSLLRPCPLLLVTSLSNTEDNEKIEKSTLAAGVKPVWRSSKDVNAQYKTTFSPTSLIMEDPQAAILMADKCVTALQKTFLSLGGRLKEEWLVESVTVAEDMRVEVRGPKGTLQGDYLIICAGPWSSKLLHPLDVRPPLRPIKINVFYWRVTEPSVKPFSLVNLDTFGDIYAVPAIEYPGMVKMVYHNGNECDPDARDSFHDPKPANLVSSFIIQNIPWMEATPAIEESCIYTMTPDKEMILDFHPVHKNIVFGCGFSGTGFKTAPSVGQVLCEMVLGSKLSFDISAFKLNRFGKSDFSSKL